MPVSENFDAYHKWLGIPAKDQPPNSYRLLGINLLETDADVIDTAANQRMIYLRECAQGEYSRLAEQLLNEVASARLCLLDPHKKAQYDSQFQSVMAPAASHAIEYSAPHAPAFASAPAVDHSFATSLPHSDTYYPSSVRPRRRASGGGGLVTIVGVLFGAFTGLAAGYFVLCLLGPQYDFLHLLPTHVPAQAAAQNTHDRELDKKNASAVDRYRSDTSSAPKEGQQVPAEKREPPEQPEKQPKELPAAPATPPDPFVALPSYIELPAATQATRSTPVTLFSLPGLDIFELTLLNPKQELDHTFDLEPERVDADEDKQWHIDAMPVVHDGIIRTIAHLSLSKGELQFSWVEGIEGREIEGLRNCVLRISRNGSMRSIPLRTHTQIAPISLDFARWLTKTTVAIDGFELIAKQLELEVGCIDGIADTEIAAPGDSHLPVVVAIGQGLPGMQLRLQLDKGRTLTTAVLLAHTVKQREKLVGFSQADQMLERLKTEEKKFELGIKLGESEIDEKIAAVKASKKPKADKQAETKALEAQKSRNPILAWRQELAETVAKRKRLERAIELAEALRGKAKMHARLFYNCEGEQVDVWRAGDRFPDQPTKAATEPLVPTTRATFVSTRRFDVREQLLAAYGGDQSTEATVSLALKWLADHQNPDGSWYIDHQLGRCNNRCPNPGQLARSDIAATALGVLPFLGAGETFTKGKYKKIARAGIDFLRTKLQNSPSAGDLSFEPDAMHGHALAAIALCEAYGFSRDKALGIAAQSVLDFIVSAQNPEGGGWTYEARKPGDTTITGWQLTALHTGRSVGLKVPEASLRKADAFLTSMETDKGAAYGDRNPGRGTATTAIGLLCRIYRGWQHDEPALMRGVEFLGNSGPSATDIELNYFGSQVLLQYGGEPWQKWNASLRTMLQDTQATEGHEEGSWYFFGDHSSEQGGRLYCTSMAAMTLEAYYRHPRQFDGVAVSP